MAERHTFRHGEGGSVVVGRSHDGIGLCCRMAQSDSVAELVEHGGTCSPTTGGGRRVHGNRTRPENAGRQEHLGLGNGRRPCLRFSEEEIGVGDGLGVVVSERNLLVVDPDDVDLVRCRGGWAVDDRKGPVDGVDQVQAGERAQEGDGFEGL